MNLSKLIKKIQKKSGSEFGSASKQDIESLRKLNLPNTIIDFYNEFEPKDLCEIDFIRLHSILDIALENSEMIPGCEISRHGFIVFASTSYGDAYCFDLTELSDSLVPKIVLIPHDIDFTAISRNDLKKLKKTIAENISEFLNLFLKSKLDIEPLYFE